MQALELQVQNTSDLRHDRNLRHKTCSEIKLQTFLQCLWLKTKKHGNFFIEPVKTKLTS